MDKKLHEKLLKLAALAARGVGGERQTAEQMLDTLLAKNGLTRADLEKITGGGERTWVGFGYHNPWEEALISQIIFKVTNPEVGSITSRRGQKDGVNCLAFELTREEEVEAQVAYSVYIKALREELSLATDAFIHTNEIYSVNAMRPDGKQTQEQLERGRKILSRMMNMDRTAIHRQLEKKNA